MKRKMFQRIVCFILSVTLLLSSLCIGSFAKEGQYKPNGTAASLEEMQAVVSTSGYDKYISNYPNANEGKELSPIQINVSKVFDNNAGLGSGIVADSLNKGNLELVGDSDACTEAGVHFVFCTYGLGYTEDFDAKIDSIDELLNM